MPDPTTTLAAWRAKAESGDVWTDCVLSIPGDRGIDHPDVEFALDTAAAAIERRIDADVLVSSQRSSGDGETFYSVRAQRNALLAAVEAVVALAEGWDDLPCAHGYRLPDGNDTESQCVSCAALDLRDALAEHLGGEGL